MTDFVYKWVSPVGTLFFAGPFAFEMLDEEETALDIPSARPQGGDGEYQEDATIAPRILGLSGTIDAETPEQLQAYMDTLSRNLCSRSGGQFFRHSDRYLTGRISSIRWGKDNGYLWRDWTAVLRCGDPYYYDAVEDMTPLATNGATSVAAGGGEPAIPVFTLSISGGGTVTVSGAGSFSLVGAPNGTYVIDCGEGTCQQYNGGNYTDALDYFDGDFWDAGLPVLASNITITKSGGANVSAAQVTRRKRWLSSN